MEPGGGEIGLGDQEDRQLHSQQMDNIQVLFRLGHDAVVRGYGEENEIDAMRAGEHVADKSFVSGNINDPGLCPARKVEISEAQIDGDPALFLLFEPVGILTGKGFDEACLAVVDVSGSTDDVRHKPILDFRFWILDLRICHYGTHTSKLPFLASIGEVWN